MSHANAPLSFEGRRRHNPMVHLRRQADGGMFDRFLEHAEELWSRGREVGAQH